MEQKPEPVDGITHFYKYIGSNFNYTKASKLHKIKGRIVLSFIVEKDGKIAEIRVIKGLGFGLDEEAVRVVSIYKKMITCSQIGKNYSFSLKYTP
jgi:TonB family protein